MRTKNFVPGLKNNQKIRVICDGVGFVTTVAGAFDMVFTHQRIAVTGILTSLGCSIRGATARGVSIPTGLAGRQSVYGPDNKRMEINVQVDLL
jgi:hypothetical protein